MNDHGESTHHKTFTSLVGNTAMLYGLTTPYFRELCFPFDTCTRNEKVPAHSKDYYTAFPNFAMTFHIDNNLQGYKHREIHPATLSVHKTDDLHPRHGQMYKHSLLYVQRILNLGIHSKMNNSFIITAVIVSYCAVLAFGQEDNVETAWLKYQADFPVNRAEFLKGKENFAKVDAMIVKHNQNSHATFQMEHNKFSTMDGDEKTLYTGLRLPMDVDNLGGLILTGRSSWQLPDSLDYRTHTCMPAVKDQGQCGSCWAFAAITPLEFARCKKTNESVLLSEQQLVDCDPSNRGCSGGWYSSAWNYLRNGSAKQSYYPYTGQDNTCKFKNCMSRVKVASSGFLERNNPASMQMALQLYGPISVAFTVTDSFYAYRSGIYNDPACDNKATNHAVVVVGWGTQNGMDYWIVRNSWGSAWGISGYFLMQRGVNKCNIENFAAAITSIV